MSTDPSAPEVSVVMSVYNGAEALPRTLHSVLSQEGASFEFIVIDDGSTDASGRILDECAARDGLSGFASYPGSRGTGVSTSAPRNWMQPHGVRARSDERHVHATVNRS